MNKTAPKMENKENNVNMKDTDNENYLRGSYKIIYFFKKTKKTKLTEKFLDFKEIYEFIKQNGFLASNKKKSRAEKTPPKDSAKKSKVIEKEKKPKSHKIKKIHSTNPNMNNNNSNLYLRKIEKENNLSHKKFIKYSDFFHR